MNLLQFVTPLQVLDALHVSDDGKKHGMYITNVLLHPKSRGNIRLKSTRLEDMPLIDPKFLDHPDDVRALVEGERNSFGRVSR